jgi:hypothetical protein
MDRSMELRHLAFAKRPVAQGDRDTHDWREIAVASLHLKGPASRDASPNQYGKTQGQRTGEDDRANGIVQCCVHGSVCADSGANARIIAVDLQELGR